MSDDDTLMEVVVFLCHVQLSEIVISHRHKMCYWRGQNVPLQ